jgi:uncharacterized protein (TIGR00730 family)
MPEIKRVCINCGSSPGLLPEYVDNAKRLGAYLARQNIAVVYGGATVGLMGAVADAALAQGGQVIGVIPKTMAAKVGHPGLSELHLVDSMHERKKMMFDLSDAFLGLPGGIGTLEEILEILTWAQLGYHQKPCGLFNSSGYYDLFLRFLTHSVQHRFIKEEHLKMLLISNSYEELVLMFRNYQPPVLEKWLDQK